VYVIVCMIVFVCVRRGVGGQVQMCRIGCESRCVNVLQVAGV